MDSVSVVAVAVILGLPALYVGVRICLNPFAGLCLWVSLLPVGKTMAGLIGYPAGEGPIVLQKLTLGDPILLLTAVGSWLGGIGSVRARRAPQGGLVVALLAAFCALSILSAALGDAGAESLIELATYGWLCLSLVVICRLLSTRVQAHAILAAWHWAAIVASVAGAAGTILLWSGSEDNLLVRGERLTGLFEGANQLQSLVIAAVPFLCGRALSREASRGARLLDGALAVVAFVSVLTSGSRGGIVFAAMSILLMIVLVSPRLGAACTCAAVLVAAPVWHAFELHREELPYSVRRAFSVMEAERLDLGEMSRERADQLRAWGTVFAEHPVLGVGLGGFAATVPRLVPGSVALEMHNSYLGVLAETGAAGGLIMFGLLATVLRRSFTFLRSVLRTRDQEARMVARALLVSYLSLLLYGTVHYGLRQRVFWFIIALMISLPDIYARARRGVPVRGIPGPSPAFAYKLTPHVSGARRRTGGGDLRVRNTTGESANAAPLGDRAMCVDRGSHRRGTDARSRLATSAE